MRKLSVIRKWTDGAWKSHWYVE